MKKYQWRNMFDSSAEIIALIIGVLILLYCCAENLGIIRLIELMQNSE